MFKKNEMIDISQLYLTAICIVKNFRPTEKMHTFKYDLIFVKYAIVKQDLTDRYVDVLSNEKYETSVLENGQLTIMKNYFKPLSRFVKKDVEKVSKRELISFINSYNDCDILSDDLKIDILKKVVNVLNEEQLNEIKRILKEYDNKAINKLLSKIENENNSKEISEDANVLKREKR